MLAKKTASTLVCAALLAFAPAALAQALGPVTFAEPEFVSGTSVHALTVTTLNGVPILPLSFSFTLGGSPSDDCRVGGGPGTTTYVSDPSIEGAPGALTIDFGGDFSQLTFGFAVSGGEGGGDAARPASAVSAWSSRRGLSATGVVSALAIPGAVQVTGYSAGGAPVGSLLVDAADLAGDEYPGNLTVFAPSAPFRRVTLEWNPEVGRFVIDNLVAQRAAAEAVVPALSWAGLAGLATAILAAGLFALRLRA